MREDWIDIEIGAFAKIQNGYAFKSKEYVDKGLRIIRIANVLITINKLALVNDISISPILISGPIL